MLCAVLFVSTDWKYAGVGEGNLFFFGGGEKREGNSSFAISGFVSGVADCKCAFSFAVGFIFCFEYNFERVYNHIERILNRNAKIEVYIVPI